MHRECRPVEEVNAPTHCALVVLWVDDAVRVHSPESLHQCQVYFRHFLPHRDYRVDCFLPLLLHLCPPDVLVGDSVSFLMTVQDFLVPGLPNY